MQPAGKAEDAASQLQTPDNVCHLQLLWNLCMAAETICMKVVSFMQCSVSPPDVVHTAELLSVMQQLCLPLYYLGSSTTMFHCVSVSVFALHMQVQCQGS